MLFKRLWVFLALFCRAFGFDFGPPVIFEQHGARVTNGNQLLVFETKLIDKEICQPFSGDDERRERCQKRINTFNNRIVSEVSENQLTGVAPLVIVAGTMAVFTIGSHLFSFLRSHFLIRHSEEVDLERRLVLALGRIDKLENELSTFIQQFGRSTFNENLFISLFDVKLNGTFVTPDLWTPKKIDFNRKTSSLKIEALASKEVKQITILKADPFILYDTEGCTYAYAGPPFVAVDERGGYHCTRAIFNEDRPIGHSDVVFVHRLGDECLTGLDADSHFETADCSAKDKAPPPMKRAQLKDTGSTVLLYCPLGAVVKINDEDHTCEDRILKFAREDLKIDIGGEITKFGKERIAIKEYEEVANTFYRDSHKASFLKNLMNNLFWKRKLKFILYGSIIAVIVLVIVLIAACPVCYLFTPCSKYICVGQLRKLARRGFDSATGATSVSPGNCGVRREAYVLDNLA